MYILSTAFACNLVVYRTFVLSVCLAERSWPLISRLFLRIWLAYHPNTCCLPHVQNLLSVRLSTVCALCLHCRAKLSISIWLPINFIWFLMVSQNTRNPKGSLPGDSPGSRIPQGFWEAQKIAHNVVLSTARALCKPPQGILVMCNLIPTAQHLDLVKSYGIVWNHM